MYARLERTTPCLEKPKVNRSLRKVPRRPKRNQFHRLFYTKDHTYERAQLCIYYKRIAKSQAIASCASVQKIEPVLKTQLSLATYAYSLGLTVKNVYLAE